MGCSSRNCDRICDPRVQNVSEIPHEELFRKGETEEVHLHTEDFRVGTFRKFDLVVSWRFLH